MKQKKKLDTHTHTQVYMGMLRTTSSTLHMNISCGDEGVSEMWVGEYE